MGKVKNRLNEGNSLIFNQRDVWTSVWRICVDIEAERFKTDIPQNRHLKSPHRYLKLTI